MALATTYNAGSATVNNGDTAVTGQGTTWLTTGLQAGDLFWAAGMSVRIASVNSNTSLTLAYPWPGANRAAQSYEVRYTPDATRALASARALLDALGNGNISAISALQSAANMLPYFTGAGAAALAAITAHGRSVLGLTGGAGKFIRSTGAGSAAMADILGTVSQSGGVPNGALVERGSNGNGNYSRYADGMQICTSPPFNFESNIAAAGIFRSDFQTWTFPAAFSATPAGSSGSVTGNVTTHWASMRATSAAEGQVLVWSPDLRTGRSSTFMAVGRWF